MKKYIFITTSLLLFIYSSTIAQVGIGTVDVDPSAIMELKSSNKGFLMPRMTANQRMQINSPEAGLTIYCTNCCENGVLMFYNGSSWNTITPCPDFDLDLDGVPNATDLDDDNDGILDITEGSETPVTSNVLQIIEVTAGMDKNDLEVGDVMVMENFLTAAGSPSIDLRAEVIIKDAGNADDVAFMDLSGGLPRLRFTSFEPHQHDNFVVKFTFVEHNSVSLATLSGIPIDVSNVQVSFSDIECSNGSNNVSEIGGFGEEYKANGNAVDPFEIAHGNPNDTWILFNAIFRGTAPRPSYPQYDLITVNPAYAGNVNNWIHEGAIGGGSSRGTAIIKYDTVSTFDLLFGVTGTFTNGQGRSGIMGIISTFELNTNTVSGSDFKTLDSDGDGCFDALEGNAGFTESQIDGEGKLLGIVNANGIPVLAGSNGQTIGSSRNNTVKPCP